ncbi:hypothetical protein [Microvirga solisilvae]|uniref:hypothetical protein n=1 Tax=Microvirga solisilvae TaxID=2919498 RepID=UPI001FB011F4|nr:hypothetical protein [Microvirga solisilvae]
MAAPALATILPKLIFGAVLDTIQDSIKNPAIPLESKLPAQVSAATAREIVERVQQTPEIQHLQSTEDFFRSRANWSTLVSLVAPAVALAIGYNIPAEYQIAAGALCWYGGNLVAAYLSRRARTATKPLFS